MKNKLKSVTLINSADYAFSTIDIDGNVLLSGANGAGKSTFLRAVLFFYNPSLKRADFGIDTNKQSFSDYYFPYPQSYLLYEYVNKYGRNYVLVFKTKKLRFKFFAIDNLHEIDLKTLFYTDGETLEYQNVMVNFSKIAISESDLFAGVEQFQKIIYGQEARKKKTNLEKYTLYNADAEYQHIGNTIKNIFLNHKIDADSIKALLVSNIDELERPSIQLEILKESIDKFLDKQESIEQFSNNIGIAESIAKSKNDYISLNNQQDRYLLNMMAREYFIVEQQTKLYSTIEKFKNDFDAKERAKKLLEINYTKQLDERKIAKGNLERDIQEAKGYIEAYRKNNIEEKLKQYAQIEALQSTLSTMQKQKEILVGKAKDRVKAFENEVLVQTNKKTAIDNQEKEKINAHNALFLQEQSRLRETKDQELEEKTKEYEEIESKISLEHNRQNRAYQSKKEDLIRVQNTTLYEEEQLEAKEKLLSLEKEQSKLHTSSVLLEEQIASLAKDIVAIEQKREHKIEAVHLKQNIAIDKLEEKIQTIQSKIDFQPDSLIAFLEDNNIAHKNHIFSILKDDLLTARDLNPRVIDESPSLYGVGIDVALSESFDELKEQLQELKDKQSKWIEEKNALITLIEQESKKESEKIEKQRGESYQKKSDIDKKIPLIKAQITVQEESLKTLTQKAKNEKTKKQNLLLDEMENIEKNIHEYQKQLDEISNKREVLKREITSKYQQLEKEQEDKKDFKISESHTKKIKLLALCDDAIKSINSRKNKMLQDEGISQVVLDKLIVDIEKQKETLAQYQSYEEEIHIYNYTQKPKIEQLDIWQKELVTLNEIMEQENDNHRKAIKIMMDEIKVIANQSKEHQDIYDGYSAEIKLLNTLRETDKEFVSKIETLEPSSVNDESYLTTTMDEYHLHRTSLIHDIQDQRNILSEKIGKFFKKIDRPERLNLIPNQENTLEDFLRVGSDIESFLNEKKIEELIKETVALFKRAIRQLSREIEDIQKHTGNINRQLNKIRGGINDLSGISVIDEIDIRLQESENRILLALIKLKKIHDDYGMDYDESLGEGLFAQVTNERSDKEKKADREMMHIFKSLSQSINEHKGNLLSLDECFELEFKVSENNNKSRWQSTLNGIGSEGTDVIVKILIYVSLLSLTKKEIIKEDVDIHCLVDEIGKLSPLYFKEVIDFTNALGIYFVNGMPSEMLVSSFKNHYKLRKVGNKNEKRTVATKIIYRIDEEERVYEN